MTCLNKDKSYDSYAWPGGYPLYYITKDNGVLCPECANTNKFLTLSTLDPQWFIVTGDINYEDPDLICDNCYKKIQSFIEVLRGCLE